MGKGDGPDGTSNELLVEVFTYGVRGVIDVQVQASRSEPGGREGDFSSGF